MSTESLEEMFEEYAEIRNISKKEAKRIIISVVEDFTAWMKGESK